VKNARRIQLIRNRLAEYHKHEKDPYAYDKGEIEAVRELHFHANEDIEFLLRQLDKKVPGGAKRRKS